MEHTLEFARRTTRACWLAGVPLAELLPQIAPRSATEQELVCREIAKVYTDMDGAMLLACVGIAETPA